MVGADASGQQTSEALRPMLVMPATNAESEKSFSAVRLIKTFLRWTMPQQSLNHLMLLHIHKYLTDDLNLVDVAKDFIAGRKQVFGNEFKPVDIFYLKKCRKSTIFELNSLIFELKEVLFDACYVRNS